MKTVRGVWRFDYGVPPNEGLILQNVSHASYFFARDMRIAGIWVGYHDPAAPSQVAFKKPYKLNSSDLPGVGLEELEGDIPRPPDFPFYKPVQGVRADFKTSSPVFGAGSEVLELTQEYLFAAYGLDPPHEPGAVLNAARMFPLVKFRVPPTVTSPPSVTPLSLSIVRFRYMLDPATIGDNAVTVCGPAPL